YLASDDDGRNDGSGPGEQERDRRSLSAEWAQPPREVGSKVRELLRPHAKCVEHRAGFNGHGLPSPAFIPSKELDLLRSGQFERLQPLAGLLCPCQVNLADAARLGMLATRPDCTKLRLAPPIASRSKSLEGRDVTDEGDAVRLEFILPHDAEGWRVQHGSCSLRRERLRRSPHHAAGPQNARIGGRDACNPLRDTAGEPLLSLRAPHSVAA